MVTYSVDVADSTVGEVVVDDKVYTFEIHSSSHEVCTNEHPDLATAESCDHVVTLKHTKYCLSLVCPLDASVPTKFEHPFTSIQAKLCAYLRLCTF